MIEGTKTTYWRHSLRRYDFTEHREVDSIHVYEERRMPTHIKRISSAIDELPPKQDFELSHGSEPQISETSGLSQQLENQNLAEVHDSQLSLNDLQQITPDRSTQTDTPPPKKKKGKT